MEVSLSSIYFCFPLSPPQKNPNSSFFSSTTLSCSKINNSGTLSSKLYSMSAMDIKGISWVGNIYQKFEAMCLEVEETMYQDTAKYVENQVQTVGASVKRFYSDVMQDLLPPSCMDPEKVINTDLALNTYADGEIHKKSKSLADDGIREDCKKSYSLGSDIKSSFGSELHTEKSKARDTYRRANAGIKRISKRDNYSKNTLPKDTSKGINDKYKVASDEKVLSSQSLVENILSGRSEERKECGFNTEACEAPVSDFNFVEYSSGKEETRLRADDSSSGLRGEPIEPCTNSILVSQRGLDTTGDDNSADEEVVISHADLIEDATQPTGEGIKQEKLKLEETCVLVDGNELGFVSQTEGKSRSYKKKFRKAFSLKLKSGRKHEYEQLAIQYKGTATPTLTVDLQTVNNHSCESEWELL